MLGVRAITDRIQHTWQGCGGGVGIKYLSRMEKQVGPAHAHKSAYANSIWDYVLRIDRHRSESNERQSGVCCTKSARCQAEVSNPRPLFRRER